MNATVRVDRVEAREGVGKNGRPWKMWSLYDTGGDRYSTFDGALGSFLAGKGGATLDIEFEAGERGRNLQSAKPHVEDRHGAEPGVRAAANMVVDRERVILREVALKAAADYAGAIGIKDWLKVLAVATVFVAWLLEEDSSDGDVRSGEVRGEAGPPSPQT